MPQEGASNRVAVAFSGGRDSTALLHVTAQAAASLGVEVIALHVHHGLSANADAWLAHCDSFCATLRASGMPVGFAAARLDTRPATGESVEAWARAARYAALRQMALDHRASLVLLAHHRRDQAETLLLQALRGAGTAGLAGMPSIVTRDGVTWARPWLNQPREAIESHVRRHRLDPIEDDSNDDTRFARNRLRATVWPALLGAHPHAESSLARAACWAQEATAALAELAMIDLGQIDRDGRLDLAAWRGLSTARRSNALRAWLRARIGHAATTGLVTRLMTELGIDRPARWPLADGELRTHRGVLEFVDVIAEASRVTGTTLNITRAGLRQLPQWKGALQFQRVVSGGVALARLQGLVLRPREGGERFQSGANRPPRTLKKQYQAVGIGEWNREGPLVYSGEELVFVPGLGIDHRALANPGEAQLSIEWLPAQPDQLSK